MIISRIIDISRALSTPLLCAALLRTAPPAPSASRPSMTNRTSPLHPSPHRFSPSQCTLQTSLLHTSSLRFAPLTTNRTLSLLHDGPRCFSPSPSHRSLLAPSASRLPTTNRTLSLLHGGPRRFSPCLLRSLSFAPLPSSSLCFASADRTSP